MPKINYSTARQYYYISADAVNRPRQWVSVEKFPGPVPVEKRSGVFDGYIELTINSTGETYHRRVMPFQFWEVKGESVETIPATDDLYIDYLVASGWVTPESAEWKERIQQRVDRLRYAYREAKERVDSLVKQLLDLGAEP